MSESLLPGERPPDIILARPVRVSPSPVVEPARLRSPLELPALSRFDATLDLGLVVLAALLVPIALQAGARIALGDYRLDPSFIPLLIFQKWLDALLVTGMAGYLVLRQRISPTTFGLRTRGAVGQLYWSIGGLASTYLWLFITVVWLRILVWLYPPLLEHLLERTKVERLLPVESLIKTTLLLIPVSIHEELLFRGLLLPYLRRIVGSWWVAVAVSSILFAALHFDQGWMAMIQILGVGTIWGVLFVQSRSLPAVILAHFAFDFVQFQLIRWMEWVQGWPQPGAVI